MRERSLVAIQQGNPKERIKHKIDSVDSGYRDQDQGYPIHEYSAQYNYKPGKIAKF